MSMKITKQDVWKLANALNVGCSSWHPGDRIRFEFTWGAWDTIVCLSSREAWQWLKGFEAGRRTAIEVCAEVKV